MTQQSIWVGPLLILASKSAGRRRLLETAGIPVVAEPASIDERFVERAFLGEGGAKEKIAGALARAKAVDVSARRLGALCIGADQVLTLHGEALHQSPGLEEALRQMQRLAGQTHVLTSSVCVALDGQIVFEAEERAEMTMRSLDAAAIARYFELAGPDVLKSVGGYQIEGLGVHLFEKISGDHASIVGLPLSRLIAWFQRSGFLAL